MNTFYIKRILLIIFSLPILCLGQVNNIDNLGFEKGDFSGWALSYGNVKLVNNIIEYQNIQTGTTQNRHQIISKSDGNDPKIYQEALPMVSKGKNYSMRIGKTLNGNTWERATTSFKVSSDHSLFQYHFAVLLQEDRDNHHSKPQKPGFSLKIKDLAGTQVACGDFDVQLEGKILAGFKSQNDIEYKNWTTGAIDLSQHIGKTLKVEITAHGCTGQGHFGYAYFDAELIKSEIKQVSVCPDINGNITLIAPEGFEKYQWNNGTSNIAMSSLSTLNQQFKVTITPFSSLDAACNFSLTYNIPFKKIENNITKNLCQGERFIIDNAAFSTTGNHTKIISRFGICDSTVNLNLTVEALSEKFMSIQKCTGETIKIGNTVISSTGNYDIKLPQTNRCDSLIHVSANFEDLNIKVTDNQKIVLGDSIELKSDITLGIMGTSEWKFQNIQLCNGCTNLVVKPKSEGNYIYKIKSASGICSKSDTVNVKVLPCSLYFPNSFSPNGDLDNNEFFAKGNSCISKIQSFIIYNRWGTEIFRNENIPISDANYGWNGKLKGNEIIAGIYQYQVKALLKNGAIENYSGMFNLLR